MKFLLDIYKKLESTCSRRSGSLMHSPYWADIPFLVSVGVQTMLKAFTVLDIKVGAFFPPFYEKATGAAVRAFEDTVNRPDHQFNKWPDDYRLFEIGTFDESTGEFYPSEKQDLGLARSYIKTAA